MNALITLCKKHGTDGMMILILAIAESGGLILIFYALRTDEVSRDVSVFPIFVAILAVYLGVRMLLSKEFTSRFTQANRVTERRAICSHMPTVVLIPHESLHSLRSLSQGY